MKKYRLLLIQPGLNKKCLLESIDNFSAIPLNLITLASYTSDDFIVKIIDENIERINFDEKADIVGISIHSHSCAERAYYIADKFRNKGIKIIFGGIHCKFFAEECEKHANSVVIGEVEDEWNNILNDFKEEKLKKYYFCKKPELKYLSKLRFNVINKKKYFLKNLIQTSRGCSFGCEFCLPSAYYGTQIRHKPIERIVEEIKDSISTSGGLLKNLVIFTDDNIISDLKYAKSLFEAIAPLNIRWGAQATANMGLDKELIKLAYDSGCRFLFIGFETLNESNLEKNPKKILIRNYRKIISNLHASKIMIYSSFMFGFKNDDYSSFIQTYNFCTENNIEFANYHIVTPYKGTELYKNMLKEYPDSVENCYSEGSSLITNSYNFNIFYAIKESYSRFYSNKNILRNFLYLIKTNKIKYAIAYLFLTRSIRKTTPSLRKVNLRGKLWNYMVKKYRIDTPQRKMAFIKGSSKKIYLFCNQFVNQKVCLDAGCGRGYGIPYLKDKFKAYYGIDSSKSSIVYAKNFSKENVVIKEMDIMHNSFKDRCFDVVLCLDVIYYIQNIDFFLKEVKRILREDGIFIIATINKSFFKKIIGMNMEDLGVQYSQLYDIEDMEKILYKYFKKIDIYGQGNYRHNSLKKYADIIRLISKKEWVVEKKKNRGSYKDIFVAYK